MEDSQDLSFKVLDFTGIGMLRIGKILARKKYELVYNYLEQLEQEDSTFPPSALVVGNTGTGEVFIRTLEVGC